MKIPTYIVVTIRILPMIAAAVTLAATVDGALAMSGGKRIGGVSSTHLLTGKVAGRVNSGLVEKPVDKPMPPIVSGRGDGHIGKKPRSDHKYSDWHQEKHRGHYRKHKHSRYESPPIISRGVVPPVLMGR